MGTTIFLFVGRAALAGARVVAARGAADAAAFPTASVAFSASADGACGDDGAVCSPVALADLDDAILAVEVESAASGVFDSGMSAVSCARSSTVLGTRFSAERVPRLSAVLDSCPPVVLCECPSAMPSGCFPAERVPCLSALLGSGLSPISLIGESIEVVEALTWPAFGALGSTYSS
eukprot:3712847-Pleurochrysis_carterae.AAC.1